MHYLAKEKMGGAIGWRQYNGNLEMFLSFKWNVSLYFSVSDPLLGMLFLLNFFSINS